MGHLFRMKNVERQMCKEAARNFTHANKIEGNTTEKNTNNLVSFVSNHRLTFIDTDNDDKIDVPLTVTSKQSCFKTQEIRIY